MNRTAIKRYSLIACMAGLLVAMQAIAGKPSADPIDVDAAIPGNAEQGQTITVKVVGSGFAKGNTVHFLVKGSEDESQVLVGDAVFLASDPALEGTIHEGKNTLTAEIQVSATATVSYYDIEVRARKGRKGKGTSLFSVEQKPNQNPPVSCNVFAPGGTCNCMFQHDPDNNIYRMIGDCETAETLFVDGTITSDTTPGPLENNFILAAVGTFEGESVIANVSHRAQARDLNIVIEDSAVAGCEAGKLHSAIRFVLEGSTPGPQNPPDDDSAIQAIWNTTVTTGQLNPLCRAFEVRRTQDYTNAEPDSLDWRVWLQDNIIFPGSYIEAGIVYHGVLKPVNPVTGPLVSGNEIGAPSCVDPEVAIAIDFGPSYVTDASSEMENTVEQNVINMAADCGNGVEPHGVGVFLQGATDGTQTTAQVSKNNVSGAFIGVLANDEMAKIRVFNNTFTGDGPNNGNGDIAVCSDAGELSTKGKRNTFIGYAPNDEIVEGTCLQ